MTRREAEKAVLEAVRMHDRKALEHEGHLSPRLRQAALDYRATLTTDDNLNICTEPDLDALNAAVAEAGEAYRDRMRKNRPGLNDAWEVTCQAIDARRAALAPKPRYEAVPNVFTVILDHVKKEYLNTIQVAALLNAKEKS